MTNDAAAVPLDTRPWQEGYEAGRRNLPGAANRYLPGTEESTEWTSGRIAGLDKIHRPGHDN